MCLLPPPLGEHQRDRDLGTLGEDAGYCGVVLGWLGCAAWVSVVSLGTSTKLSNGRKERYAVDIRLVWFVSRGWEKAAETCSYMASVGLERSMSSDGPVKGQAKNQREDHVISPDHTAAVLPSHEIDALLL